MTKRVHVLTLGCPKNQVDSEIMLGVLARRGHELVLEPEAADVLVVNTCSFIGPAKEESIDAILDMARVKAGRGGRRLIVAGCLAQRAHLEVIGGVEVERVALAHELGLHALEVEALRHLAQRLVDRVVDLLQVDVAYHVEGRRPAGVNRRGAGPRQPRAGA